MSARATNLWIYDKAEPIQATPKPLIESVLALFSVNRADVDTQLSADPLNNDRVDHSLRGDVDGRHT